MGMSLLLIFFGNIFVDVFLFIFFNETICLVSNYLGKAWAKIGIWKTKPKVALNVVNNK